ncbi:MAG: hypothetical protein COA78_05405 [Blastopirellula sp.]|nr:MAG: hypothetical protein COA78_05405 [Blastopirellula sp.]
MSPLKTLLFIASTLILATSVFADSVPSDLELTRFAGSDVTPCPACLCVSATGEVYAGVDLYGSLGKGPGKGRIVRLIDNDHDGVADSHTIFAEIDNPRGLISVGDKLWVLHTSFGEDGKSTGMDLVLLRDVDGDGKADGPREILVRGICSPRNINARGTDHSTNGIQLGIDGWIYIAVGDFGFADAQGTDGTKLTLLGGGIVRVRPDGTEMELYTTGMRNIYDIAIDPFMNIFTRGNTNDGGGWNIRFSHHIQSGEYGYPRLFKNFADEIIPALQDLGGGSGVGALFLSEPTWPAAYQNQPLMADWGRQTVYLHRLTEDGPSFTQKPEEFVKLTQVTDLDVDPSGQMFMSAWDNAGFKGNPDKGYVVRVVPKDWKYQAFPALKTLSTKQLFELLRSESASTRLHTQQELLLRAKQDATVLAGLKALAKDESANLGSRVAALYGYAQLESNPNAVLELASDPALVEFALRAASDRLTKLENTTLATEKFATILHDGTPRQRVAAAIALGRIDNAKAAQTLLAVPYEKSKPGNSQSFTEVHTLRRSGGLTVTLPVSGGMKLYLTAKHTNPTENPAHFAYLDSKFILANGQTVSLADLKPVSGKVFINKNPDGTTKRGKKDKSKVFITSVVNEKPLVYSVPKGAVKFETKIGAAGSSPTDRCDFFASTVDPNTVKTSQGGIQHATPNPDVIVPHLAAQSLVRLHAVEECLAAIGTSSEDLAFWALSRMHDEKAVTGLISKLKFASDTESRQKILNTLARLYQQEAPYDGSWWWSTKPDTRGPYYKPITWASSDKVAVALQAELKISDTPMQRFLAGLNDRERLGIQSLGTVAVEMKAEDLPTLDLEALTSKLGEVGKSSLEDVLLALDDLKGDPKRGREIFTLQKCVACHALKQGEKTLGPFMGQVASVMKPDQIATAILRPDNTISQGFRTTMFLMEDGKTHTGFVTFNSADKIIVRDATGKAIEINPDEIEAEKHLTTSMMPKGLVNGLSLQDFVSLVSFLSAQK